MATVLIDYENVGGAYGLEGAEYLNEKDDLCIFYSKSCPNIRRADSMNIEESGCTFRLCELKQTRKNALDFYIATEAGIAYMSGEKNIVLVTRDDGFESIRDYFKVRRFEANLVIAPTIERGLLKLIGKEDSVRREQLLSKNDRLLLSAECARIDERRRIRESVVDCFEGTEYEDEISRVLSCIDRIGITSKQDLYRESLHEFGRASGTIIYNMLKQVV